MTKMTNKDVFTGGEKDILQVSLDRHRDAVLWKLRGLGDEALRRPLVPSGTNLLGLVKHLAANEYFWFCWTFGVETEPLPFEDDDPEADLRIGPGGVDRGRPCLLRARPCRVRPGHRRIRTRRCKTDEARVRGLTPLAARAYDR